MNSMILLQNELSAPVRLTTAVSPALGDSYWGSLGAEVAPTRNPSLFWVSRNAGITDGVAFTFTARTSIAGVEVTFAVRLTGTLLGSDIAMNVQAGGMTSPWSATDAEVAVTFTGQDGKLYRLSGAYVSEGARYDNVQFTVAEAILPQIDHVVVLMLENRSLDHLLGWLYDGMPPPARFIPAGSAQVFDGLMAGTFSNTDPRVQGGAPVYASKGAANTVPDPDPGEEFARCTAQIGTAMDGFLADYATAIIQAGDPVASAAQIMQCHDPNQVPVIAALARNFAVSDAWHASVPSQTWANRAFAQAGASAGHVNNDGWPWNIPTIFDVLEKRGLAWRVYNNSVLPSLTKTMFFEKYAANIINFAGIADFQHDCAAGTLPTFSFLEPSFGPYEPDESYHPPYDVMHGEAFLAKVYAMLAASPARDRTLFVVLFDEHGGTYDHVKPPAAPQSLPQATDGSGFAFDRLGVRVPAIVISSYTAPGTVFRSDTGVPFDHTSILATLRDWLGLQADFRAMLPSARIATAPTLAPVLSLASPRAWPALQALPTPATLAAAPAAADDVLLNDNQKAILMALGARVARRPLSLPEKENAARRLRNHGDAHAYLAALLPHLPMR
ncbi:MAG: hypothetical protein KGL12_02465 [Rhodospirillales bacterium]|nr:hypothetical protein [Rhodospirillales bacterium]